MGAHSTGQASMLLTGCQVNCVDRHTVGHAQEACNYKIQVTDRDECEHRLHTLMHACGPRRDGQASRGQEVLLSFGESSLPEDTPETGRGPPPVTSVHYAQPSVSLFFTGRPDHPWKTVPLVCSAVFISMPAT